MDFFVQNSKNRCIKLYNISSEWLCFWGRSAEGKVPGSNPGYSRRFEVGLFTKVIYSEWLYDKGVQIPNIHITELTSRGSERNGVSIEIWFKNSLLIRGSIQNSTIEENLVWSDNKSGPT